MSNKDRGGYNITDQYGMYFVTFTVVGWVDLFTRLECKRILVDALKYCQQNKGLKVHAYVIMSSHVHLILSSSSESKGLSSIIRDYKSHTSPFGVGCACVVVISRLYLEYRQVATTSCKSI